MSSIIARSRAIQYTVSLSKRRSKYQDCADNFQFYYRKAPEVGSLEYQQACCLHVVVNAVINDEKEVVKTRLARGPVAELSQAIYN